MDFLRLIPGGNRIGDALKESPLTDREFAQLKADGYNAMPGDLDGYDCPVCHNKGQFMYLNEEGKIRLRDCECQVKRRSMKYLSRSGLTNVLDTYTWERWQCREPWQEQVLRIAKGYAEQPEGWFLAAGRPGTGKTHICTAICGELLKRGIEVRYLLWRDFTTKAKAIVNDDTEYRELVEPFKRVPALYLDDLFKTGRGQEPSVGDCNLAFELLNARYADPGKVTIISTELSIQRLLDVDEAIGSRIYERSKGHYIDLSTKQNWRLVG